MFLNLRRIVNRNLVNYNMNKNTLINKHNVIVNKLLSI